MEHDNLHETLLECLHRRSGSTGPGNQARHVRIVDLVGELAQGELTRNSNSANSSHQACGVADEGVQGVVAKHSPALMSLRRCLEHGSCHDGELRGHLRPGATRGRIKESKVIWSRARTIGDGTKGQRRHVVPSGSVSARLKS
jgi:hypothetical protein